MSGPSSTFQQGTSATSGAFTGLYLWSNTGNWTDNAVPTGGTVTLGFSSVDDIATLTLADVVMTARENLIAAGTLTIGTLTVDGGSSISAETGSGYPGADLVIDGVVNSGVFFTAVNAGATLDYAASVDGGNYFRAYSGGMVLFGTDAVAASGKSYLQFEPASGTFAFRLLPAASSGTVLIHLVAFSGVTAGDAVELPIGTAQSVTFGSTTLTVLAGGTSYEFTGVSYGATTPTGFSQQYDASTGLQAITFTAAAATTFQQGHALNGLYYWDYGGNWTAGIPVAGANVTLLDANVDNIATLSLTAATLDSGDQTSIGAPLTIGDLTVAANTTIAANTIYQITGAVPVLTLGGITGSGGTIAADGSGAVSDISGSADPGETYQANNGGELILRTTPNAASTFSFSGNGTLAFTNAANSTAAALTGVAAGDTIELAGSSVSSVPFGSGTGTGTIDVTTNLGSFDFTNVSFAGSGISGYTASRDTTTGLAAVAFTVCFAAGTRIGTADGETAVEALRIGDQVRTHAGALRPVKWIGRRSYDGRFIAGHRDVLPIRFAAGSLGGGLPRRDLLVSPRHAMFLDGVLVPAELLVNGRSIVQLEDVDSIAYFHVELASHDVILAEGAPSESFVDCDSRGIFQNAPDYARLYPQETAPAWQFCAPRLEEGPAAAAIRRRLTPAGTPGELCGTLDRADWQGVAGWAFDAAQPGAPVSLEVLVDGAVVAQVLARSHRADLAAAGLGAGRCAFEVRFPAALSRRRQHLIVVRRADDRAALPDSPVLLARLPPFDRAQRQRLAVALRAAAAAAPPEEVAALAALLLDRAGEAIAAPRAPRRAWAS